MKIRESGMPEEKLWDQFFDIELILSELQINSDVQDIAEIGCGYGTFTIPASKTISGKLFSFDIEVEMLATVKNKIDNKKIENIFLQQRDVLTQTTGLQENSIDYLMLFNILHHDTPNELLNEAYRILKPRGRIGIIHWRSDIETPRGPDLSIRPTPEHITQWIEPDKFTIEKKGFILPPFHFGMLLLKN
ncbi:MAG: class I SAM-dependent methyltransferase [Bacteroidales bacterium]